MDATTNTVYVSEVGNQRLSRFNSQGKFLGYFGSKGDNQNQFNYPRGMVVDKHGLLHICDHDNDCIVSYGQL